MIVLFALLAACTSDVVGEGLVVSFVTPSLGGVEIFDQTMDSVEGPPPEPEFQPTYYLTGRVSAQSLAFIIHVMKPLSGPTCEAQVLAIDFDRNESVDVSACADGVDFECDLQIAGTDVELVRVTRNSDPDGECEMARTTLDLKFTNLHSDGIFDL